jgi:mRNA-capping enzyme
MVVTMDLNVLPGPEDNEDNFEGNIEEHGAPEERFESAAEIARRVILNYILAFRSEYLELEERFFVLNYIMLW